MDMQIDPAEYKILVVDDVTANVLLLKVMLSHEKYRVVTAEDGPQALEAVGREHPDLVLLDVMMPGMSGFEVAETLRASEGHRDLPIIFLTALNAATDVVRGFKVGGNDFISKPFNKEELLIRVKHQVSLVAARRIIQRQTAELQNTILERDKLYSVIAHDLRSPIGSIKMIVNVLTAALPAETIGSENRELLDMANEATEGVFSLLDNLLKWTKSQIGRLKVVYQDFDLVTVVQGVAEIFNMVAQLKNIAIRLELPEKAEVRADADMMKTIVRNLLSNALKFSYENSEVVVSVAEEDGMAVVRVTDFGKGIPEKDQDKLLSPDTHFSSAGTRNEEGSGLGLLLCVDFAEKNGGRLWFESQEGKGATFAFSVPLKG